MKFRGDEARIPGRNSSIVYRALPCNQVASFFLLFVSVVPKGPLKLL
jgi:hypothetical protein